MLDTLNTANRHIAHGLAWIGGTALIGTSAFVSLDVLLRKFVGYSFAGADEVAGYVLAICVSFGVSFALLEQAHVRIDLLTQILPRGLRASAEVLALAIFLAFLGVLTWYSGKEFLDAVRHNSHSVTPLQTPLWLPEFFWVAGLLFAVWTAAVLLLQTVWALLRGRYSLVDAAIGANQMEREIHDELEGVEVSVGKSEEEIV